jgi:hypothetical protein
MNDLAWMYLKADRLTDAEGVTRALIPLEEAHPSLGVNSPQVIGAKRMLMEILAKRGEHDESKRLNEEGYRLIEAMKGGKFAKYEKEEIIAMDEVRDNLEKWSGVAVA